MKIVVVQIGHYGDMALLTPVFRAFHHSYPEAAIHVLAARRNYRLICSHPLIDKLWIYDKKPLALLKLLWQLRRERFDWHIDPKDHLSRESSLLARFIGAEHRVGFNGGGKQYFTHPVPDADENNNRHLHCITRNLQALIPLGISPPATPPRPELFPEPESEFFTEKYCRESFTNPRKKILLLNLSAGDPARYWKESSWAALLKHCADFPVNIVINAVASDKELAQRLATPYTNVFVFPSRSIMDAVSLVQRSAFVVTPDTAIIHIAAAFDVPCVALFNRLAWNFDKFYPLSVSSEALLPPSDSENLADIPPEEVYRALCRVGFE